MTGQDEGKYIHIGATIEELYYRQKGKCWLEIEFDDISGERVYGDLYCTDGEHKLATASLLNPSSECMKCVSDFIAYLFEPDDG